MNFDQDYNEFIDHIKNKSGSLGPMVFTAQEDSAIRFFIAYLNCRYQRPAAPDEPVS